MPLHDVGYRGWEGQKTSDRSRWWVVAATGVQLAFRSTWLSRTLILSWVPAIVVGGFFFAFEQSLVNPGMRQFVQGVVLAAGTTSELAVQVITDPEAVRHEVWASMILVFFRYPQAILLLLVVAMVSTRLISSDLRNRGYLMYFSRPLSPTGYILGKAMIVWAFIGIVTTLPAMILFCVGLALSPEWTVIFDTWDLPLRVIGASLALMIPVSAVALACSALSSEARYSVFAWFAFWVLGWVSYSVLYTAEQARKFGNPGRRGRGRGEFNEDEIAASLMQSDWEIISPFHVLGRVQQYIFGLYPEDQPIWHFVAVLVIATLLCFGFVRRQVVSRLRM